MNSKKQTDLMSSYLYYEAMTQNYNLFLRPPPVPLQVQIKGKKTLFNVDVKKIICIISQGKLKTIYLTEKIKSIEGYGQNTNKIILSTDKPNMEELCALLDSIKLNLLLIKRGTIVNYNFYDLHNKVVKLNVEKYEHAHQCSTLIISSKSIESFKQGKQQFEEITKQYQNAEAELKNHQVRSKD